MTELGERYYTTPHLHINGRDVGFGRDSDGLWVPLSDLYPDVEDDSSEDVEKATDPMDIARICEALTEPMGSQRLASKASMSYVNVQRLIPRLLRQNTVHLVKVPGSKGRSFTRYELT